MKIISTNRNLRELKSEVRTGGVRIVFDETDGNGRPAANVPEHVARRVLDRSNGFVPFDDSNRPGRRPDEPDRDEDDEGDESVEEAAAAAVEAEDEEDAADDGDPTEPDPDQR